MLRIMVDWIVYSLFGIGQSSRLGAGLHFFIYDSIKMLLLLFVMIAIVGTIRTYIPKERIKRMLGRSRFGIGNLLAALFGALTPFCSCSSIPIFLSFLKAGVPLGITFSFLVTSPLVNEYLVILMLGFFGWKITAIYVVSGVMIGFISGIILGRMGLEKHLEQDLLRNASFSGKEKRYDGFSARLRFGVLEAKDLMRKLWLWILVGVGIGALIHNFVPEAFIHGAMSRGGVFTVPIATLLGVPIYGSCAAIVPIALVLFQKGFPLGTALAFMMSVSALSLPQAVILRRAMDLRLILLFFGIVTAVIIFTGYLIDFIYPLIV